MIKTSLLLTGVMLVLTGVALAQDESPGEPRRTPAQLEQALFGTDRKARLKAGWEAIRQGCFGEEVWMRLLDVRRPTVDEEEETKYLAAYALARCGSSRCLPRIKQLLEETPKCLRYDPELKQNVAVYPYQYEAASAYHMIAGRTVFENLDVRLGRLEGDARADAIMEVFVQGEKGYQALRSPESAERMPVWWRSSLAKRLGRMGAPGARAFARALARVEDADVRWRLCMEMLYRFGSDPFKEAERRDPTLRERWNRRGSQEEGLELQRAALPKDPALRAAVSAAVKAYLAGEPLDVKEQGFMFGLVDLYDLRALEEDLIQFCRRNWRKHPDITAHANESLVKFGTERALDFVVRLGGTNSHLWPRRFAEKYTRALEEEQATPWSNHLRFLNFSGSLRQPERALHVDLARIQNVLDRVRQSLVAEADPGRRRQIEQGILSVEWTIRQVRTLQEQAREEKKR